MKNIYLFKLLTGFLLTFATLGLSAQTTVIGYTGTWTSYTVPAGVTNINIEALGAQGSSATGGTYSGGMGALMSGDFDVTPGETLIIVVGGMGNNDGCNGGGGGGSFVVREAPGSGNLITGGPFAGTEVEPMIIAGGGSGTRTSACSDGNPGVTTETATSASGSSCSGGGFTSGTAVGYGGSVSSSSWGSAGGGFIGDGAGEYGSTNGGQSFLNGAQGGGIGTGAEGGFGCGGSGEGSCGGGGGGGYTGGDGGYIGGGGGSYNVGTSQVNAAGFNSGNGQVTISVNCSGIEVVVSDTGVCTGDEVTLTGTSVTGGTITWDGGVTNGVAFVPPTGSTIYTASSTSIEDCAYSIEIFSTDVPTIGATSSTPAACEGAGVILYGTGGDSYSWDMGVTDGVPFYPSTSETYTVTGSLLGCEGPPATITIDVASAPEVIGTVTPSVVCVGETYSLSSSGTADVYDWGVGVSEGSTIPANVAGTYIYTVIGTEAATGCTDTVDVTVVVNETPVVDAGPDQLVCEGEEVTLMGSGAATYTWDNGVTDSSPFTATNIGTTTYTVTGTDANGCTDTDVLEITVLDAPDASGVVTHETTGFNGAIDLTVTGGTSAAYAYDWSHGPTSQDVTGLTAGDYTVIVDDGACTTEVTFTVLNVLGNETLELENVSVYPNPTEGIAYIELNGTFNFTLYNALGSVITTETANNKATIDLTTLENGVYFIQIDSENGSKTVQITKK